MIPAVMQTVAQTLTTAVAATGRPLLTLFATQVVVGAAIRAGLVEIHGVLEPAVSFLAIAIMGVFALAEGLVQHQTEMSELLDDLYVQRLAGGASASASALLLASVGVASGPPTGEAWEIIQLADASGHPPLVTFGVVTIALGINLVIGWVRAEVLEVLREMDAQGVFQWLETGGALTVLVLLPFLPLIALTLVVLASAAMVVLAVLARTGSWAVDRAHRRPCPECGAAVRMEASRCAHCATDIAVEHALA